MILFLHFVYTLLFTYLMSFIVIPNYYLILAWLILGNIVAFLIHVLFLIILYPLNKLLKYDNKLKQKYIRSLLSYALFFLRVKIVVHGKENIPDTNFVAYGNHKSHSDVLVEYVVLNKPMGFVAKKEIMDIFFLGSYMKTIGCIGIDRSNDRTALIGFKEVVDKLKKGYNIGIYPEGGIRDKTTDKMVDIKPGAYKLAFKAQVDILPISIKNAILVPKNYFRRKTTVHVYIHKPIKYEDYKDLNTHEIGEKVFNIVNSVL